jgi:hypothetical protein
VVKLPPTIALLATESIPDAAMFFVAISPTTVRFCPTFAFVTESVPVAAMLAAARFPIAVMFPPAVTLFATSRFVD